MQEKSVFISAPAGFSKTEAAAKIKNALGLKFFQDDWVPELAFRTNDTLIVCVEPRQVEVGGHRFLSLKQGMALIESAEEKAVPGRPGT